MGLATAHAIIERHRSAIHVCSKSQIGTSFFIYLPIHPESAPPEVRKLPDHFRVLVIHNAESTRSLARDLPQTLGACVITAAEAYQASGLFQDTLH